MVEWASLHADELRADWELATPGLPLRRIAPLRQHPTDLLARGGIFAPIAADDSAFRCVTVDYGTIVWPGDVDIALETLIWDGPTPADEATRRPERFLRPQPPRY